MKAQRHDTTPDEGKRLNRRRLLATLGVGIAGAYVAPTLFSLGQAQAWHDEPRDRRYRRSGYSRPSYSRPSYSRPSYSRPSYSRPSGGYHRHTYHYHTHDLYPDYHGPSRW
ncbi:hypothetical protein [Halomonas sp. LBP4]|uniref:hypothetical protein n=1 Tax=Halomonas sp. LBP4 TaxID=2044917 RepID=UPI0015E8C70D|nr:hypothetical protein [Halomonas sp. LBP4]